MPKSTRLSSKNNGTDVVSNGPRTRSITTRNTQIEDGDESYAPDDSEFVIHTLPLAPKVREICTPEQRLALLQLFERTKGYPTSEQQDEISQQIGKSKRSIQVWFQNQRHPRDKSKMADFVKQRILSSPRHKHAIKSRSAASRKYSRKRRDSISTVDDTTDVDTSGSSAVAASPPSKSSSLIEASISPVEHSTIRNGSMSSCISLNLYPVLDAPSIVRTTITDYQNEPSTVDLNGKTWSTSEVQALQALELVKTVAWTIPERWTMVTAGDQ